MKKDFKILTKNLDMERKIKILLTDLKKEAEATSRLYDKKKISFNNENYRGRLMVLLFCIRRLEKILKDSIS